MNDIFYMFGVTFYYNTCLLYLRSVVFLEALNECIMYVSCMYDECIRNLSWM